jgi:hypothetical protein
MRRMAWQAVSVRPYLQHERARLARLLIAAVRVKVLPRVGGGAVRQGHTLVHFSAQRKQFVWVTLGTLSTYVGHNSSQTGHKTAQGPGRFRLS